MRNARKGDHEVRAEDAPAGRHSYSGSIKRVDKVNEVVRGADSITCFSSFKETDVFAWQGHNLTNVFVKPKEQSEACFDYALARKGA